MNFSKKNHELLNRINFFVSKKIITTIVFIAITFTTVHSQITRPNNRLKTKEVNKLSQTDGLRIANLDKKSMKDLTRLNIPVSSITRDKLNAKPIRTWAIGPNKLYDGQLRLKYFNGHWSDNKWKSSNRYCASFKFRALGGVEYRMKLKMVPDSGMGFSNDNFIYVTRKRDNRTTKVVIDEHKEFNYLFKEAQSGEIEIMFTAIPVVTIEGRNSFRPIRFSEIRIDRIN